MPRRHRGRSPIWIGPSSIAAVEHDTVVSVPSSRRIPGGCGSEINSDATLPLLRDRIGDMCIFV